MKDNCYKAIVHIIQKTQKMWEQGDLESIRVLEGTERRKALHLQMKAVNVNARGRKAIVLTSRTEKYLMEWLQERWRLEQRVSRTMIFRKLLDLNPKFCGGVKSDGHLDRLK